MPLAKFVDLYPRLIQRLRLTRLRSRTAHAWIFTGNDVKHIREFVIAWLQTCICPNLLESGDGCGSCMGCRSLEQGNYPYWYELKPLSKSRQILIAEVRELEHHLYLRTAGEKKIGLFYEADRMVNQAQNAFLKTLEEPPQNTLLVLVTSRPEALLPTIRSRCQIVPLNNNQFQFDFDGQVPLYEALASMNREKGALVATHAAKQILEILNRVRLDTKTTDKTKAADRNSGYVVDDPTLKKKIAAEEAAKQTAAYLAKRDHVFCALHTWFAQEYMRANGLSISELTHAEIYEALTDNQTSTISDQKNSLKNLILVDNLLENLRFNVDEKLMIQDFCQKICSRR